MPIPTSLRIEFPVVFTVICHCWSEMNRELKACAMGRVKERASGRMIEALPRLTALMGNLSISSDG